MTDTVFGRAPADGNPPLPDRQAMQQKIDRIVDPAQRERVQSGIDHRYHLAEQEQRAHRRQVWGAALQAVQDGTLPDHLPRNLHQQLDADSLQRLRRVHRHQGRQPTSFSGFTAANRLFNLSDHDLADLDISEQADQLSVLDLAHLQDRQNLARQRLAGQTDLYDPMNDRVRGQLRQAFARAGLTGALAAADRGRFRLAVSRKLAAAAAAAGTGLTPEQENALLVAGVKETAARPALGRSRHFLGQATMPPASRDLISDRFALRQGRYPTEREVLDIYLTRQAQAASEAAPVTSPERENTKLPQSYVEEKYREYDYDPIGLSDVPHAVSRASLANKAHEFAKKSARTARQVFPRHVSDGPGDALRHAYWNFLMTVEFGEEAAKGFGDAHERFTKNHISQTLMDLHNNMIGRKLALDPANRGKDPVEVIIQAMRDGRLVLWPVRVPKDGSPAGQPHLNYEESEYS